jgi:hypothetical protein
MHLKPLVKLDEAKAPETLDEFITMYRAANNLTWMTMMADRYQRAMIHCADRYSYMNMQLVHATFLRKRIILIKSLLCGIFQLCTGRNSRASVTIARYYDDVIMLAQEMAELMDPRCAGILEGHLLHGS